MTRKIDFINGNTKKCLMAMVLPMIAAMFLNMAYNLVDSLWIGNLLGETAYAALTNSTPLILLLTSVAMGATNGISILLSQAIGSKDNKKIESLIATSFAVAIIFSLILTAIFELSLPAILQIMNTPTETYEMAYNYLSIYLLGYLAVYLFLYFTAVLRSFGNAMFQMISMLVSTILNAVLDPIFIHFFGFHGAAIATLISQSICYSITAIAAYGITGKLETILFYPAMALNMVLTTIIGQCVGGKRTDRVKDYLKCALKYGSLFLFLLSAIIVSSSKYLSMLFVRSSDVASIVSGYFLIVGIGYILNTITNCFLGMLNGLGQPSKSMLLMIFYYIIVRMPLAYLFSYLGLGLNGIWIAVLISHICAAIAAMLFSMLQLKRKTTIS